MDRDGETARKGCGADDCKNEPVKLVPGFAHAAGHRQIIVAGRSGARLGMRVPVPDIVQSPAMALIYFALFQSPVPLIGIARAAIAAPRTRCLFQSDVVSYDAGEEQSTCLAVPKPGLSISRKASENLIGKMQGLSRRPDLETDHAAPLPPHTGQRIFGGQTASS